MAEPTGDHGTRQLVDDRSVPWRVFLLIAVILAIIGGIYWATAYEEGGTVMLIVATWLALWIAAYLWLQVRKPAAPPGHPDAGDGVVDEVVHGEGRGERAGVEAAAPYAGTTEIDHYLPHASAWPLAIGLGAATVANGLVLGLWVIVPGAFLMALGVGGFIRQTRRRD
jgi:hypothetical protein